MNTKTSRAHPHEEEEVDRAAASRLGWPAGPGGHNVWKRSVLCLGAVSALGVALAFAVDVSRPDEKPTATSASPTSVSSVAASGLKVPLGPPDMVWIPGGEFIMGSDDELSRLNERPAHRVAVSGFWMDVIPVTNAEFAKFVDATGYVTTAERAPDWEELKKQLPPNTPKADDSLLVPGSLVFVPTEEPVDLGNMANFWRWTPGASWRHPEGPHSSIEGRQKHPVVHVSWDDAVAYAAWARKRLPTEAEWEFAARGGLEGRRYAWGDEFHPQGRFMANTWTGAFPYRNTEEDGFAGTSPVKSFPANGYGVYDMAGNVWNWCADWYRPDTFQHRENKGSCCDPSGPDRSFSPADPYQQERVIKGGSHLCHPDYCASYRPSARRGLSPDTGMSHVGFRCIMISEMSWNSSAR